ncbi:hypothetical protein B2J93_2426 [Marssonina coronariae]|uniref:Uncharacterized protein n=1 Tax=Diplocarpon coronariae TaxID=2795749 RepID=A0A218Z2E0_9HELO|nr:hypothetical protein B2J93_2426 [Marssonina coronariae]
MSLQYTLNLLSMYPPIYPQCPSNIPFPYTAAGPDSIAGKRGATAHDDAAHPSTENLGVRRTAGGWGSAGASARATPAEVHPERGPPQDGTQPSPSFLCRSRDLWSDLPAVVNLNLSRFWRRRDAAPSARISLWPRCALLSAKGRSVNKAREQGVASSGISPSAVGRRRHGAAYPRRPRSLAWAAARRQGVDGYVAPSCPSGRRWRASGGGSRLADTEQNILMPFLQEASSSFLISPLHFAAHKDAKARSVAVVREAESCIFTSS